MSDAHPPGALHPFAGTMPASARVGAVVDKYRIVRVLGQGGMGAVFEARHLRLDRRFAIKFLLPRHAENPDVLRRFENEAKAAGGLEHPNLAAVVDFGRADDGSPYIVMEFLEGHDCARLLRDEGRLTVQRAANIIIQACRGVAKAHGAGIVHRDLKPENLFVVDAGDGADLVKVLDFGIAKLRTMEAGPATGTGEMFGTAHYMSPEQARGAGEVDQRTDVWSLGVVLYELLSGHKPFEGRTFLDLVYQIQSFEPPRLSAVAPELPIALTQLVERAMAKELDRRIPSALALADQLSAILAGPREAQLPTQLSAATGEPSSTGRAGGTSPARVARATPVVGAAPAQAASRSRFGLVASAAVGVVAAGAGLFLYVRSSQTAPVPPAAVSAAPAAEPLPSPAGAVGGAPAAASAAPSAPPAVADGMQTVSVPSAGAKKTPKEKRPSSAPVVVRRPAAAAPAAPPPNPTIPLERPKTGRPIYIDKDDPFGP